MNIDDPPLDLLNGARRYLPDFQSNVNVRLSLVSTEEITEDDVGPEEIVSFTAFERSAARRGRLIPASARSKSDRALCSLAERSSPSFIENCFAGNSPGSSANLGSREPRLRSDNKPALSR